MNKNIQVLAQKEVTRKEFLATIGFGILSIVGLSSFVKLLLGQHQSQAQNDGYGSSAYGGENR